MCVLVIVSATDVDDFSSWKELRASWILQFSAYLRRMRLGSKFASVLWKKSFSLHFPTIDVLKRCGKSFRLC
jgi:hypothetical protein